MAINVSILRQVPIMGVCIITLTAILYPIIPGEISSLAKEDGPIENATALILLSLSILLTVKAIRLKKSLTKQSLGYTLVAALLFFLGFGEEISWGQRIFSYETSDFFIQHNRQKEPNFHNLEIGTISINRILFSYGLTIGSIIYFSAPSYFIKPKAGLNCTLITLEYNYLVSITPF